MLRFRKEKKKPAKISGMKTSSFARKGNKIKLGENDRTRQEEQEKKIKEVIKSREKTPDNRESE
jgi:hypothetical protein